MNDIRYKNFKISAIIALLLVIYGPTFLWMKQRFLAADSYYSHGFLIPVIAIFLIWQKKERLMQIPIKSFGGGFYIFLGGLFLQIISAWWSISFTSGFSFLIVLIGLVLYFFGKKITKEILFPLGFLVFMIPLPLVVIAKINLKMKLFSAHWATLFLSKIMDLVAVRSGSYIKMAHCSLSVDDPCSGLKSLISLLALGAMFAYLIKTSRLKKLIIFLSSVPMALIANAIRVIFLCLVSEIYGTKIAMAGFFHNLSGLLVFVVAFIGMMFISKALD